MRTFSQDLPQKAKRLAPGVVILLGVSLAALLGTLDVMTTPRVSFVLLYLLAVAFVACKAGSLAAGITSLVCVGFMVADDWRSIPRGSDLPLVLAWNGLSRFMVLCAVGWLISRCVVLTGRLHDLIEQRAGQYHAMLSIAMDGFASLDSEGHFIDTNDAFCRMLGYGREELLGSDLRRVEVKESPLEMERHLARIRATGGDRFETLLKHKDGTTKDVEVSVSMLPGGNGALIAFTREIGERKRGEARLRESEERYRTLAESSPDAIFIIDRNLQIQYANSAAALLWGRTPESLLGNSQGELFCGKTAESHAKTALRAMETGEALRFDEQLSLPAGERWLETRFIPVQGPGNKVHSLIVTAVDISEHKQTESLLEAQRDLALTLSSTTDLDAALNSLLEVAIHLDGVDCGGVYLCDPKTGDLDLAAHKGSLSPEFIHLVAHYPAHADRAKLVKKGEPMYEFFGDTPVLSEGIAEAIRAVAVLPMRHEGVVVGCLNLGSHSADTIPPRSRLVMEALAAQTAGAIARIRAESERHRLEQQLLEITDREQARIGHELHDGLCQQLVSLAFDANSLRTELAEAGRPEAAVAGRIAEYLDKAITEARQLSRGLFPVRLEAEGLPSALEELAQATQTRFGIACEVDCDEFLQVRSGVMAVHLFRIAQEAVTNAIKHGHAKSIGIRLTTEKDELRLEIDDDGIGFPASGASNASGLGLHIMDYRARSIGGNLQVSSSPNVGATVSCCIPRHQDEKLPA